jgi:hypothetical protein
LHVIDSQLRFTRLGFHHYRSAFWHRSRYATRERSGFDLSAEKELDAKPYGSLDLRSQRRVLAW